MEAGDGVRLQEIGSGEVRLVYMQRSWMALGADNSYAVKMSMRKLDARIAILRRLRMVVRANDRRQGIGIQAGNNRHHRDALMSVTLEDGPSSVGRMGCNRWKTTSDGLNRPRGWGV